MLYKLRIRVVMQNRYLAIVLGLQLLDAERTVHQQDAVDGLPRRHRGRTACLRRIDRISQIWNT